MAQLNGTDFLAKWATLFADNTTGEISAQDMRDFRQDIEDSFVNMLDGLTFTQGATDYVQAILGDLSRLEVRQVPEFGSDLCRSRVFAGRVIIENEPDGNTLEIDASKAIVSYTQLKIVGLPTSSAGLASGTVWSDSGTLKIV
jgi:hypothetical protein